MDERKHLLNGIAQRSPQANQERPFRRSGLNLLRAAGTEDGVLDLQIRNLLQKDGLGHMDEKNEKGVLAGKRHGKCA
jgi:hypothetical protein